MNQLQPKAELVSFPFDSNWVSGTVGDYTFEAKLFDDPTPNKIWFEGIEDMDFYANSFDKIELI